MRSSVSTERRVGVLRRTAQEVRHYKVMMRILSAALGVIILLLAIFYIVAVLYKRTGSFTVHLNKYEMLEYGLQLSEAPDMLSPGPTLNAEILKEMTNISEDWLPETLGDIDGEDNGDNYICYTFYLQNSGKRDLIYDYQVSISNITRDLDEAIRIRVYRNEVPTTYAKTASDGSGPEPGTKAFYSNKLACNERIYEFAPGQTDKYTVVIWIEGDDPDCVNWLINGEMRIEMSMSIVQTLED